MDAVAMIGSGRGRSFARRGASQPMRFDLKPVALAVLALLAASAVAQPAANQLPMRPVNGVSLNATVAPTTGTVANPVMAITQQTTANNRAVIEWSSFSIGSGARVNVSQPNAQSVLLNRVVADEVSQIYGGLSANGRVFIVNPFGVVFGGSAQVSVGSLLASSLDLTPAMSANGYQGFLDGSGVDLAGSGQFGVQVSRADNAAVNKIQTTQGGSVSLVGGGFVSVNGVIEAPGGRISLAVAPAVRVVPVGQSGFVDLAITLPGASGAATVGGLLNASSSVAGTRGGQVDIQAPSVTATFGETGNAVLSANGPAGGGSITLGGTNTRAVQVESGSILSADALNSGDGGSIAVRATFDSAPVSGGPVARTTFGVADVYGTLLARGGPGGGNGGRIETSGTALNTSLQFVGSPIVTAATIDARAQSAAGLSGTWTVDPFDVTITNAATVAGSGVFPFTPTGPGANVRAADISTALNNGTSVEISTGAATVGNAAGDITLGAQTAIARTAGTAATTLTLRAHGNVTLAAGSSIGVGTGAGPVNVNLFSDLDGNGSGVISMQGSAITTGGGNATLSGGLDPSTGFASASAQSPGVLVQNSAINTVGATTRGDVVIRGSGVGASANAALQTGVVASGSTIDARNISIHGQAGASTAVRIERTGLSTDSGLIQIRGVATRNLSGTGRAIGVDLGVGTNLSLGVGSLLVAGRGDENGLPSGAAAAGVRADDLRVGGAAASAGRVTVAGQSVGSTGPGIVREDLASRGLDVANVGSVVTPVGANVVIGASAGPQAPRSLGLDTTSLRVLTTGAVNLRPLGVDGAGNVVELPAIPIVIGAQSAAPAGSFLVDPALLNGPGIQTGGLSATQGYVIGSSAHTGLITLDPNALPNQPTLALNLQNEGAGSAGLQIGAGNVLGSLALLSAGNIGQSGAINVQSLLVRGGAASRVDLSNAGNRIGVLAFDSPQFLSVATQGNLTVDAANGLGCDIATNAFTPLTVTNSVAGAQTVLRSIAADMRLNRSITLPGAGASSLDLVTPASFVAGEGALITGPAGSQWRVWTQGPANAARGTLQAGNLYGCAFGDSTTCSLSGVALPTGNRFMFVDRPLLTVNANPARGVAGQPIPAFTYAFSGVVNGDAAGSVLGGSLATAATVASPPGAYAITQGTVSSPLGYRVQYQGADLTLSAPSPQALLPYDLQNPARSVSQAGFLADQRSDVYGRNLSLPYICTAASIARNTASDSPASDPLASEWGKVRTLPQLSGCLDVKDGGQCDAF